MGTSLLPVLPMVEKITSRKPRRTRDRTTMRCATTPSSTPSFSRQSSGRQRFTTASVTALVALAFLCPAEAAPVAALPAVLAQTSPTQKRAASQRRRTQPTGAESRNAAKKSTASKIAAKTAPAKKAPKAAAPTTEPEPAGKQGFVRRLVRFIIKNKFWVIGALGTGLALSFGFLFLSSRRRRGEEYEEEETVDLIPLRTQSAQAEDDEDEGPRRVLVDPSTGRPKTMPTRDDSEYALVVDEDELQLPAQDGTASGEFEKSVLKVQELVEQSDFEGAYDVYSERLKEHELHAFHAGLERRLGKYFLKKKDFRRAAQILEHHISTQPQTEIEPEIYFDLGYAFYKQKTLTKSRQFFQVFAERERNPAQSDRARRLVERLEKLENPN